MEHQIQTPYLDIKREEFVIAADSQGPLWRTVIITQIANNTILAITETLLRRDGYMVTTAGSPDQKTFWIGAKPNEPPKPLNKAIITDERLKIMSHIDQVYKLD